MEENNKTIAFNRIENIAKKVYRNHKNALYMLVNDLEEFFEINNNNDADKMTTDEFDKYIRNILDQY